MQVGISLLSKLKSGLIVGSTLIQKLVIVVMDLLMSGLELLRPNKRPLVKKKMHKSLKSFPFHTLI